MDEARRTFRNLLLALASPLIVVLMVFLAILAGLAYYLAALFQGFWLLFRDLPKWVLNLKKRPPLPEPHFLGVPHKEIR